MNRTIHINNKSLKSRILKRQSNFTSLKLITLFLFLAAFLYIVMYMEVLQMIRNPSIKCDCKCKSSITTTTNKAGVQTVRAQTNYSVISASVPDFSNDTILIENGKADITNRAWGYLFLLPLTALSWKEVGFEVIAIITVDYSRITPDANRLLRYVDKALRQMNVTILYFDVPSTLKVRLGQMLRLIPALTKPFNDDDFLITSDADLWPLNPTGYEVPYGKTIQILNSECCGIFKFNGTNHRMFPLSHITMTAKLWKKIFKDDVRFNSDASSVDEEKEKLLLIQENFRKQLDDPNRLLFKYKNLENFMKSLEKYGEGEDIYSAAKHNGKLWYLDQKYASVLINTYTRYIDNSTIDYVKGLTCKRLYTRDWNILMNQTFPCVGDAHVFKDRPWNKERWLQLSMLMKKIFRTETLNFLEIYKDNFLNIFEGKV